MKQHNERVLHTGSRPVASGDHLLERWCKDHPEATEIQVAYWGSYPINQTSIQDKGMSPANVPQPGWYALSVNYLYDREKQYRYFLNFKPVAMAGYSIYIYHLTKEDVDHIKNKPNNLDA